jgi:hypothetical protein
MTTREEEATLALALWKALDHLSNLLWVCYEEEFLNLAGEDHGEEGLEENTEVAF